MNERTNERKKHQTHAVSVCVVTYIYIYFISHTHYYYYYYFLAHVRLPKVVFRKHSAQIAVMYETAIDILDHEFKSAQVMKPVEYHMMRVMFRLCMNNRTLNNILCTRCIYI